MHKIIQFVKDWLERRKNQQGEYLVIYFDRDNEVRHRLQFADKAKAERAYGVLEQEVKQSVDSHMLVQMFKNENVVKYCDSEQMKMHLRPTTFVKKEDTVCIK